MLDKEMGIIFVDLHNRLMALAQIIDWRILMLLWFRGPEKGSCKVSCLKKLSVFSICYFFISICRGTQLGVNY